MYSNILFVVLFFTILFVGMGVLVKSFSLSWGFIDPFISSVCFFLLSICSLSVLSFFRGFGCWFHQSDGVFISLFFRSDIFFSPLAFLSALLLLRVFQQLAFPYAFTYIRPVAISGLVSVC